MMEVKQEVGGTWAVFDDGICVVRDLETKTDAEIQKRKYEYELGIHDYIQERVDALQESVMEEFAFSAQEAMQKIREVVS